MINYMQDFRILFFIFVDKLNSVNNRNLICILRSFTFKVLKNM